MSNQPTKPATIAAVSQAAPPPPETEEKPKKEQKEKTHFKLTSAEHEEAVLKIPEALREDILWLGGFLVNRCNSNYARGAQMLTELGFKTHQGEPSDNYVYQVATCLYFTKNELGEAALNRVKKMVQLLRGYDRLISKTGRPEFVETSYWHLIHDKLMLLRVPDNVVKWLPFVGPTDVGFSRCAAKFCEIYNHKLCIHVECPAVRTPLDIMVEIGRKYNVSSLHRRRRLEEEIRENVNDKKLIILDNFQNLYDRRRGVDQPSLNWLRKLTDDTGVRFAFKWTKWSDLNEDLTGAKDGKAREYLRQFLRRFCGAQRIVELKLPVLPPDVELVAKSFLVEDLRRHLPRLVKVANQPWGNFTPLFDLLQAARRQATNAGSEKVRDEHIVWPEGI